MKWWKLAVFASIAWVLLLVALTAGVIWYVSARPLGVKEADAREELVGMLVGALLGGGLVAIWLGAYIWHKVRTNRVAAVTAADLGLSDFAPCPACSSRRVQKVTYTWWGGLLGPALFRHVKCLNCGATFNGLTGKSNAVPIAIYLGVGIALVVVAVIAWIHWAM